MPEWDILLARPEFVKIESDPDPKIVSLIDGLRVRGAKRIYDLGCGIGRHTVLLARNGFDVFASDISKNGLVYTRQLLDRESLNATLFFADMTAIPLPDNFFDATICRSVITHNTVSNIKACIREMHRTLRPNGLVYVTFIAPECSDYGNGREVEPNTFLLASGPEAGILHHFTSKDEALNLTEGFQLVDLIYDLRTSPAQGSLLPYTSAQWIFIGEKREQ